MGALFEPVERYALHRGTPVDVVEAACFELGIDLSEGVPRNRDRSITEVLQAWAREGSI